jgi:hypothetical protein
MHAQMNQIFYIRLPDSILFSRCRFDHEVILSNRDPVVSFHSPGEKSHIKSVRAADYGRRGHRDWRALYLCKYIAIMHSNQNTNYVERKLN